MSSSSPFHFVKKINNKFNSLPEALQILLLATMLFTLRIFFIGFYQVPTGSMEPTMLVGEGFFCNKCIFFSDIKRGDIISFNQPTYHYSENPVIHFFESYIYGPENWTKRVIACPGDHIEGKIENGIPVIYLNEEKLDEPYINPYPIVKIIEKAHVLTFRPPFIVEKIEHHYRSFDPKYEIIDRKNQPFYGIHEKELVGSLSYPSILKPQTPTISESLSDEFDVTLDDNEYWVMGDNRKGSFDSRGFGKISREIIRGKILFRIFSFDSYNSLIYELLFHPIIFFTEKIRSWKRWFSVMH